MRSVYDGSQPSSNGSQMTIPNPVLSIAILLLLFSVAVAVSFAMGRRFKPDKLKLPFMEFSPVEKREKNPEEMFQYVSVAFTEADTDDLQPLLPPQSWIVDDGILIYVGWHAVCDAYIERFLEYPSDENLAARFRELGSQNIEFIKIFRDAYESRLRQEPNSKSKSFPAQDYFSRAISLVERIDPTARGNHEARIRRVAEAVNLKNLKM